MLRTLARLTTVTLLMVGATSDAGAWCVRGVERGDTLRLRSAPTPVAREMGRIPPSACGIAILGPCRGAWCRVRWQSRVGWSNATYLTRGGPVDFPPTPQIARPAARIAAPPLAAARGSTQATARAKAAAETRPTPQKPMVRARDAEERPAPDQVAAATPRPPGVLPETPLPSAAPTAPSTSRSPAAPALKPQPPAPTAAAAASPPVPVPPTASAPTQEGPPQNDAAREVCVVDIPKGDTLKVRAGPGTDQALRYGYPAEVCGVRITGPCADGWCPVDYRGYRGWTEQRFLK